MKFDFKRWSIAAKLALTGAAMIAVVVLASTGVMSWYMTRALSSDAQQVLREKTENVARLIAVFDRNGRAEADRVYGLFAAEFTRGFTLVRDRTVKVGAVEVPTLLHGGKEVALDFTAPDAFTRVTGGVATVFVRSGDDFVRVSTSLKNEKGERALGTYLGKQHPAYAMLLNGETYVGRATLFGKPYMTKYQPIMQGKDVIGLLFVGADISDWMATLRASIEGTRVGDTGFMYAVDAKDGPGQGTLIIHPAKQGTRLLEQSDATAAAFAKDLFAAKSGTHQAPWNTRDLNASGASDRIAVFTHAKEWDWIIVADARRSELDALARQTTLLMFGGGIASAVVLAVVLYVLARRIVLKPLAELGHNVTRIASGDLSQPVTSHGNDEIARLAAKVGDLQQRLHESIAAIGRSSEAVHVAATEIAAGNRDLSQRTEEQASSLEETASSMEQLSSTVKQNVDSARQASELASSASEIAVKGGAVVGDVVHTMGAISESSKKIADIIGVIDGIAFQTNILALNAAVEAARAGEQGRGFAVVAGEVRNLAQRSAGAAKEIKALIEDSVGKVDSGAKLVDQAGQTMEEVVSSIKRVTDIMAEITAASQEQSSGIEQVNQAVTQMDQVTQQNAAVVEEAAAAAESMQQQAHQLADAVAVFKLGAHAKIAENAKPPVRASKARLVGRGGPNGAEKAARLSAASAKPAAMAKTGTDDEWTEF